MRLHLPPLRRLNHTAINASTATSVTGSTATANGSLLAKDGDTKVDIFYGKADLSDVSTG